MELDITEVAYNNKVRGTFKEIVVDGDLKRIKVKLKDDLLSGTLFFKFDEVRMIFAKLVELDSSNAKEINKNFDDSLYEANSLANKLSIDKYDDESKKIEDMKKFVKIYLELLENTKLRMIASEDKKKSSEKSPDVDKQQDIVKKDDEESFDEKARKVSDEASKKFSNPQFFGEAVLLDSLLTKMEEEKKKVKETQEKRISELKKETEIKKEELEFAKQKINLSKDEIHINSDFVKVEPLVKETKNMSEFRNRKISLDSIDYSKL